MRLGLLGVCVYGGEDTLEITFNNVDLCVHMLLRLYFFFSSFVVVFLLHPSFSCSWSLSTFFVRLKIFRHSENYLPSLYITWKRIKCVLVSRFTIWKNDMYGKALISMALRFFFLVLLDGARICMFVGGGGREKKFLCSHTHIHGDPNRKLCSWFWLLFTETYIYFTFLCHGYYHIWRWMLAFLLKMDSLAHIRYIFWYFW